MEYKSPKRMIIILGVTLLSVVLLALGALFFYLRQVGVFERLKLRKTLRSVAPNSLSGVNWIVDLSGLWGELPIFASFTTPNGLLHYVTLEHNDTAMLPEGGPWFVREISPPANTRPLTYLISGPFPPKTTKSVTTFYRMESFPYLVNISVSFESLSPPGTAEQILDDIGRFILDYESHL